MPPKRPLFENCDLDISPTPWPDDLDLRKGLATKRTNMKYESFITEQWMMLKFFVDKPRERNRQDRPKTICPDLNTGHNNAT